MGDKTRLNILHLGENLLSGEIPDCWMKWNSLKVVKLGNNNLTGKIPTSLGYLPKLQSLHLRNNSLSGKVPNSFKNCSQLVTLDLGLNKMLDGIPLWMTGSNLPYLKVLGLRSNRFSGEVPSQLCNLTSLQILDIADNNLSGEIPRCISDFKAMITQQSLRDPIFYSFYSGEFLENAYVVTKGREVQYSTILTLATSIDMSLNNLSGGIPQQVTVLGGLRSLNLSGNHLTGLIPMEIGEMTLLESADLSTNQLTGEIPRSLSNLNFLNYLNLSYNNLSGEIPLSTQVQSLDSSSFIGNLLCGPPLKVNCSSGKIHPTSTDNGNAREEGNGVEIDDFLLSMLIGFVVSLLCLIGPLMLCSCWRHAYFGLLDRILGTIAR